MPRAIARLGLPGALGFFVALAMAHALVTPHLLPFDERAHAAYAWYVGRGELPDLDTPIPHAELAIRPGRRHRTVWLANHPPLYYVVTAPAMRIADPVWGVTAARLTSIALAACGLVYAFLVARLLVPWRPEVWLGATCLTAAFPGFVHVMSLVHNDSLAFLTATATFHAGASILCLGPTRRRAMGLCAWGVLACATRFSGSFTAAIALIAALSGWLLEADTSRVRRAVHAAATAAALALGVALATGWFYQRNVRIYGDITGSAALMVRFHRRPSGTPLSQAAKVELWRGVHDETWSRFSNGQHLDAWLPRFGLSVLGAGAFGAATHAVRARPWPPRLTIAWVLAGVWFLLHMGSIFAFVAKGGLPHARYIFPALAFWGVGLALGFSRPRALLAAVVGVVAAVHWHTLDALAARLVPATARQALSIAPAMAAHGVPHAELVTRLLFVVSIAGALTTAAAIASGPARPGSAS
jgi:hypothetical protein